MLRSSMTVSVPDLLFSLEQLPATSQLQAPLMLLVSGHCRLMFLISPLCAIMIPCSYPVAVMVGEHNDT